MQHTSGSNGERQFPERALHGVDWIRRAGRCLALIGAVLPLLLIGGLKFTAVEIEALQPLINGTPWLSWLYPVFGEAGASYFLGIVEITAAALLLVSPWSLRAAVGGGALVVMGEALARRRRINVAQPGGERA